MEILKQGRVPDKKEEDYRGECQYCGCQVKCKPTDPAVLPYSRTKPVFQVQCPTAGCGCVITLEEYVTRTDCFVQRNVGQRA